MVKITCQSISNVKVDIEVNLSDNVSILKDKMVEQGKATAESIIKFTPSPIDADNSAIGFLFFLPENIKGEKQ